jgi:hypothetical protein
MTVIRAPDQGVIRGVGLGPLTKPWRSIQQHDIAGGPGQTAVRLVKGPGPENTVAVDDLLTEDLAADSAPVGRGQGT